MSVILQQQALANAKIESLPLKLPTETLEVDKGRPKPGGLPGLAGADASHRSPQCAAAPGQCGAASGAQSTVKRRAIAHLGKMSFGEAAYDKGYPLYARDDQGPQKARGGCWDWDVGLSSHRWNFQGGFWGRHNSFYQHPPNLLQPRENSIFPGL